MLGPYFGTLKLLTCNNNKNSVATFLKKRRKVPLSVRSISHLKRRKIFKFLIFFFTFFKMKNEFHAIVRLKYECVVFNIL